MKHYINSTNQIFAYEEDGSQDHLISADLVELTVEDLASHLAPKPLSLQQQIANAKDAIQSSLDNFAKEKDYDSIISACSYAISSTSAQAAEGQHCSDLRDLTWRQFYLILAEVEAGDRTMPVLSDLLLELPELTWPTV